MTRRIRWILFILLIGWTAGNSAGVAAPGDWDNETDGYLNNGGFEGEFYPIGDEWVAEHWTRVYLEGSGDWNSTCRFANGGPNCDQNWVEKIAGVDSMIISVEDLAIGQPFNTVLYQSAGGLVAGQSYSFSGWTLKLWGGSANHNPPSDPYSLGSRVGVDPTGGTDPTAATVQWGEYDWEFRIDRNVWTNQRLAFTAQGSVATLFVQIWHKWQRAETQALVDAMELFDAPTVSVAANNGSQPPALSWAGTLPAMFGPRGSNFHLYYDVQRQQGTGAWETVAHWTEATSYTPSLAPGEQATFRVVPFAFEPPGSPINWPPTIHIGLASPPVTLVNDATPPTAEIAIPTGRWQPAGSALTVGWQGYDGESGVASFDVEYRHPGSAQWQGWLSGTTRTSATFPQPMVGGDQWEFRVRAHDQAGNLGAWSDPEPLYVYGALLQGFLLSAAGTPLLAPQIEVASSPFDQPAVVGHQGNYRVYLPSPGSVTLSFHDHEGTQRLPTTTVSVPGIIETRPWWVAAVPSSVTNGHFEASGGWTGSWTPLGDAASGTTAAQIVAGNSISQSIAVSPNSQLSLVWRASSPAAQLRVTLGSQEWLLAPIGTGWQPWSVLPSTSGMQTLTLSSVGASVVVDQISLGQADRIPQHLYLPFARR